MRRLFKFKYHKLALLAIFVILTYFIFSNSSVRDYLSNLQGISYFFVLIAGMLFSFGFTTPFAIGFFVTANIQNIYIASLIGGFGALISDSLIFAFIKLSFMDEFGKLIREKPFKLINKLIHKEFSHKTGNYLLYIFAGLVISSPLPDEIGVTMLAGLTHIKPKIFALLSFLLNSFGILVMLLIGRIF